MNEAEIRKLEIDLLLETLKRGHGYDFSSYARASLERRIEQFQKTSKYDTIGAIIPELLRDTVLLKKIVYGISVPVTELFRNPQVFRYLRETIIPVLRTYPHIKIWNAGCATGQEVYSIAIMMKEEGLYDRTQIYATDFNDQALEKAKEGIYSIETIREQSRNYLDAGGTQSFSDYYYAKYNRIIFDHSLRENIVFANHNLASDAPFGEMHLILCRNVMIYFDQHLQDRVLDLFLRSLIYRGFLCLGSHESIQFSKANEFLIPTDEQMKIYRKSGKSV